MQAWPKSKTIFGLLQGPSARHFVGVARLSLFDGASETIESSRIGTRPGSWPMGPRSLVFLEKHEEARTGRNTKIRRKRLEKRRAEN